MATNGISDSILNSINNTSTQSKSSSAADDIQDRFMTLFMAQLRNQDPLNPTDNAQMTAQLAQMNMVKGVETLNGTMEKLLGSYNDAFSVQAAGLIGHNVLVPGKDLVLADGAAVAGVELKGAADKVTVTISDADGKEVARQQLGARSAGTFAIQWDGKNSAGEAVKEGTYRIKVEASQAGSTVEANALQLGTVSALTRSDKGFLVEVAGLGALELSNIKQVF